MSVTVPMPPDDDEPFITSRNLHKHVSMAWCRCLVISMASVTPLENPKTSLLDGGSVNNQQLCIDLRIDEFWQSSFEDANLSFSVEECVVLDLHMDRMVILE
ncbi:tetratricopeptide repeat (TPR)-like superfamily protein [Artemisia annua]|uniref:Tetratricopeptide repeat (TPR)-like superfamily protein n=1 Tax=Artemisia annua TaxID=35608 RepID=A0A2U1L360_ARTAN|nr:tetratricopeptide repeat (TPR)-like superfamily protein [Artemisia annua]